MTIRFITLAGVLEIHRLQLQEFGGAPGIRDQGLLESAVASPKATFGGDYLHGDLVGMAAALAQGLVKNHPFIDGNKRVGAQAAMVFLELNGARQTRHFGPEYEQLILDVAAGTKDKDDLDNFYRTVYVFPA